MMASWLVGEVVRVGVAIRHHRLAIKYRVRSRNDIPSDLRNASEIQNQRPHASAAASSLIFARLPIPSRSLLLSRHCSLRTMEVLLDEPIASPSSSSSSSLPSIATSSDEPNTLAVASSIQQEHADVELWAEVVRNRAAAVGIASGSSGTTEPTSPLASPPTSPSTPARRRKRLLSNSASPSSSSSSSSSSSILASLGLAGSTSSSDSMLSELEQHMFTQLSCARVDVATVGAFLANDPLRLYRVDHTGATMLHIAAAAGFRSLTRLLIMAKADIDARDSRTATALHHASVFHQFETCEELIEAGASLITNLSSGTTILHQISNFKQTSEVDGVRLVALIDRIVQRELRDNDSHRRRLIDAPNRQGESPLFCSINRYGVPSVVGRLLELNADPNTKRVDGVSALECALSRNNSTACELLLQYGARPQVRAPGSGMMVDFDKVSVESVVLGSGTAMLPSEVLALIFSYLPLESLYSCNLTCRRWHSILECDPSIWCARLHRIYRVPPTTTDRRFLAMLDKVITVRSCRANRDQRTVTDASACRTRIPSIIRWCSMTRARSLAYESTSASMVGALIPKLALQGTTAPTQPPRPANDENLT